MRRSWEGTPTPRLQTWLISFVLSSLAAVGLAFVVDDLPDGHGFFMEDGPIEMVQAAMLLGVAVLFFVAFVRSANARALFCLIAAYGCIFAVTREVPRCGSAFVGGDLCLTGTWKRSIVLVASALALLALVLRPVDWRRALSLTTLRWTWPCLFVLAFLVAAEALEDLSHYSEIEEFLELVAYLHLGAMAAAILRRTRCV